MSEDQDLLARIGRLSNHINMHRMHNIPNAPHSDPSKAQSGAGRYQAARGVGSWKQQHGAPYPRTAGRGGRISSTHRNRVLKLNQQVQSAQDIATKVELPSDNAVETALFRETRNKDSASGTTSWISKRDRHMQLINTSIYDKETQMRMKGINETLRQKALREERREKARIAEYLHSVDSGSSKGNAPLSYETSINGLRFRVMNGGSKLSRIFAPSNSTESTPKQASVGGVIFYRSKNGNLYRSGLVKAQKKNRSTRKINKPCKHFTTTGRCLKGPLCPFVHDPNTVAICPEFLQKGTCMAGQSCDLSHDPTPERVPACLHYLRGHCSKLECRYAHVRVNPSAPVCKDFANIGYCGKGVRCAERHVHECPDYANTGICGKTSCHLPHVDRAGQIRKHAANSTGNTSKNGSLKPETEDSDLSSDDEEIGSDDVDSDGLEEDTMDLSESHPLSRQQDFVRL